MYVQQPGQPVLVLLVQKSELLEVACRDKLLLCQCLGPRIISLILLLPRDARRCVVDRVGLGCTLPSPPSAPLTVICNRPTNKRLPG